MEHGGDRCKDERVETQKGCKSRTAGGQECPDRSCRANDSLRLTSDKLTTRRAASECRKGEQRLSQAGAVQLEQRDTRTAVDCHVPDGSDMGMRGSMCHKSGEQQ